MLVGRLGVSHSIVSIAAMAQEGDSGKHTVGVERSDVISGSCRCALIGVPWRLSMLSTFSTFANVLF